LRVTAESDDSSSRQPKKSIINTMCEDVPLELFFCLCGQAEECLELRKTTLQLAPKDHPWVRKQYISFTKVVSKEIGIAFRLRLEEMWSCSLATLNYIASHHFLEVHMGNNKHWSPLALSKTDSERSDDRLQAMNGIPQFAMKENDIISILSKAHHQPIDKQKLEKLKDFLVAMPIKSLNHVRHRHAEWRMAAAAAKQRIFNLPLLANAVESVSVEVPAIDAVAAMPPEQRAGSAMDTTAMATVPPEDPSVMEANPCTIETKATVWDKHSQESREMGTFHLHMLSSV
jgi:hypothetical protein